MKAAVKQENNPDYFQIKKGNKRGTWVAQSVRRPTSAQVMISRFVSSSPTSGSVLMAGSLEPALDSVSPFLSAPPWLTLCLSLSKINKRKKKIFFLIKKRKILTHTV